MATNAKPKAAEENDRSGVEANVMVWVERGTGTEYKLSFEHAKLLYIISFYGNASKNPEQPETWLRRMQLDVLMYEAIVAGKLDYDYAPSSRVYSYVSEGQNLYNRRYLNISQVRCE